ncbi:hypothetical protein ACTHAM_002903 [Cellulomonas soli]|uniref:hypothetical protein n=1 Tax=Cellulomonas soli TaxID=931535 RepID=UPI003F85E5D3
MSDPVDLVCRRAAELNIEGKPDAAIALIDSAAAFRGEKAPPICATELASALVKQEKAALDRPAVVQWFAGLAGEDGDAGDAAALAAAILVTLAVIARLSTSAVSSWPAIRPQWSRLCVAVGLVLAGEGAVGAALTVTGTGGPRTWSAFWLSAAWGVLGCAVLALGLATRLRLTLECTVAGTPSTALQGRVVARLSELGIEPPSGVEIPRATDVEALDGSALSDLPEGRLAKAVTRLARSVLATTPWTVLVDEQADGSYAVAMSRNGRAVGSALVSRDVVGLTGESASVKKDRAAIDLVTLAAAFILAQLSDRHGTFPGLGGATDWRSIGLLAVATTQEELSAESKRALAGLAVQHDRRNWPAQAALQYWTWRRSTDKNDLGAYIDWLDTTIGNVSEYPNLELRLATTRAFAQVNRWFVTAKEPAATTPTPPLPPPPAGSTNASQWFARAFAQVKRWFVTTKGAEQAATTTKGAEQAATSATEAEQAGTFTTLANLKDAVRKDLEKLLSIVEAGRAAPSLVNETKPAALALALLFVPEPEKEAKDLPDTQLSTVRGWLKPNSKDGGPLPDPPTGGRRSKREAKGNEDSWWRPPTPKGSYAMGCTYATLHGSGNKSEKGAVLAVLAVRHLRDACVLKEARDWIGMDPQLAALRETAEYRESDLMPTARGILDVEPFATHADALKRAGLSSLERLRCLKPDQVSDALGIWPGVVATLAERANLRASMGTDPWLDCYGSEVIDDLARLGRARIADVRLGGEIDPGKVAREVLKRCRVVKVDAAVAPERALEAAVETWVKRIGGTVAAKPAAPVKETTTEGAV